MKISQKQKRENREKIILAAVELITQKGFKSATMKNIARNAGLGDATIYNYFPTKEHIVYGYYEDQFEKVTHTLKTIEKFNEYSFQEQLQTFFETLLETFLPDREFVQKTFKTTFFALSQQYGKIRPIKDKFMAIIEEIFDAAIEVDEIPEQVFRELTLQFFWEYYIGIVIYWSNDTSDKFEETTVLIDKSLDLACASLKAGIGNKLFDMGVFLFKNHVLTQMDFLKDRVQTIHKLKKKFMES